MSGPLMINSRQSSHGVSHSAESSISSLSTKSSSESGSTSSSPFSETKKQFFIEWFRNDPSNVVRGGGSPPAADRPPQGFVDGSKILKLLEDKQKEAKSAGNEADVLKLQLISSIVLDDLTKIDEMDNPAVQEVFAGQPARAEQTWRLPRAQDAPPNNQVVLPIGREAFGGQPAQAFQTWRWPPRGLGPCGPGSFFGPGPGHTWGDE